MTSACQKTNRPVRTKHIDDVVSKRAQETGSSPGMKDCYQLVVRIALMIKTTYKEYPSAKDEVST